MNAAALNLVATTPAAANDTFEPTTLECGQTFQAASWRAQRMSGHIEVTSLVNAGKRGKTCARFLVAAGLADEHGETALDGVAAFVMHAVKVNVSVDGMARSLADVALCGLSCRRSEVKGCDVDAEPEIRLNADLVRARFSMREFHATFTWILDGGAGHDTSVGHASRKDAAKAYAWARENLDALKTMDRNNFTAAMRAIGVSCR